MSTKTLVAKMGRGLLTANVATVLRAVRYGPSTLDHRIRQAYCTIDPFGHGDPARLQAEMYLQRIPEIHLHEIVDKLDSVNVDGGYRYLDGALPWVDLIPVLAIARDRKPATMLEIGTYFGYSTRILALNLPETTVHTIDLPPAFDPQQDSVSIPKDDFHLIKDRRVGEAFLSDPSIHNIIQHYGDTATWDFQPANDATFFFIDGSHTYEYARNDTEKCLAVCKDRRATLLWHDCDVGHSGVARYLAELVESGFPVKRIGWTHLAILDC